MRDLVDRATLDALLSGLAFLAASLATWLTHRTNRAVKPNGETLADLMHRMIELESYTHTRNHDLINGQTSILLFLRQIAIEQGWGAELWPEMTPDMLARMVSGGHISAGPTAQEQAVSDIDTSSNPAYGGPHEQT